MESQRPRLLVIDPDPSVRALLVAVARRQGLEADSAGDTDAALEHARAHDYAAVIVEPHIEGGEALLRALAGCNVIVATTASDPAPRPGVTAVLRKPFLLDELTSAIDVCGPADA